MRVNITDVNDNIPQFGSNSYTTSFPENISLGAVLLVVSSRLARVTHFVSLRELFVLKQRIHYTYIYHGIVHVTRVC